MAQYGLGNFIYEFEVSGGKANFHFFDQEDPTNTADVSVDASDFPEGIKDADSRQVAEIAYDQCQRVLNEKRDARVKKEAEEALDAKQAEDARVRQAGQDYLNSTEDVAVAPAKEEKDGTKVYNTENVPGATETDANKSDDKKKK